MHIGLFTHEYPPEPHGGIGAFTRDLAEGLVAEGQKVTVFAVNPAPAKNSKQPRLQVEECRGVRVIRFNPSAPQWMRWRPGILWQRWQLRQLVRQEHRRVRFDVLEAADAWGWFPFGRPLSVPLITRLHGAMFFFDKIMDRMTGDPFTYRMELRSLAASTHYIGVSNYVAQAEMAMTAQKNARVEVIYNSVDTDYFRPDPSVPVEEGLIVFVNSIQYRKGVQELCLAMNEVCAQHPTARLVFIGGAKDRPGEKTFAEKLLETVHPEYRSRIQFLGWHDSRENPLVLRYLRQAHLCCYPSHQETFGLAPAEAMSAGTVTVYSSLGPGPEIIEHDVSGLLCNPSDPADIAKQILILLQNPEKARQMGLVARERVVRLFDRKKAIRDNIRYYQHCCGK